ncbi:hypothetical protein FLJC2902T_21900 [Flavobacterium limnosediminis JC2902]|uniref:Uncharacterized protein n=1 Tax=Flavobacterium limnosediminis JC2902 TaxID=1341181 RepID=V6SKV5_9FLAO|nr:hypothetical protein [Flavobacterium limnosediminis]ESU27216.1 hypothetical protein FLJC2902T_21900 [Flavobacterium limnosediminis JC2902]
MENPTAQKLINKIQLDLFKNGFNAETLITDLKKLREYALEEQNPVLVKAIRLTYEHIENNNGFFIAIPDDEPIEGFDGTSTNITEETTNMESLEYLISLFLDLNNKNNVADLREYNKSFMAY